LQLDSIVGISEDEYIMEVLSLGIDAVGAVCDAPVLNALKPILSIVAMICDRAKVNVPHTTLPSCFSCRRIVVDEE
jgi:hypothetical protein